MRITTAIVLMTLVAGCGDPMTDVPRYSDQDIPAASVALDAVPAPDETEEASGGLLSRLLGDGASASEEEAPDFELAGEPDAAGQEPEAVSDDALAEARETAPVSKKRRGLLGLFAGSAPAEEPAQVGAGGGQESVDAPQGESVELASVTASPEPEPRGRGLFGLLGGADPEPGVAATSEVEPGRVLPYGQVARVCGVPGSFMGKKIAAFPEKRSPRYALYDSDPGKTGPHTFYLTGFDDGCARQFTASLAVFGTVSMHEQLRYGLPAEVQPYSTTDEAYEDLKRDVCNVPRRKPCGQRIGLLERDTVFLSIYERFGGNAQWTNLLLHDGQLLAQDKKGS